MSRSTITVGIQVACSKMCYKILDLQGSGDVVNCTVPDTLRTICVGNSMVLSAIWIKRNMHVSEFFKYDQNSKSPKEECNFKCLKNS